MKTKNTNIVRVKAIQLKLGLGALTIILFIPHELYKTPPRAVINFCYERLNGKSQMQPLYCNSLAF
jgi:hypothetical protein